MKADKKVTASKPNPVKPIVETNPDPEQTILDGIRILARMIVNAHLEEMEKKRLLEKGARPKMFLDKIYVAFDCVDMNDTKERQRLHQMIDEALKEAARQDLEEQSPPLVLKRDGIRIRIYP